VYHSKIFYNLACLFTTKKRGIKVYAKYLFIFLMILQQGCMGGIFKANQWMLPNDYEYFVPQSGMHMIGKEGTQGIVLGYYLNRAYVNDRYVMGEVMLAPEDPDGLTQTTDEFTYFIFDTQSGKYLSDLTKSQFEEELKRLGLWNEVELIGRDNKSWLKNEHYRK
jgi:hypothetical protein